MSGLGGFSMWELFRGEAETQMRALGDSLLALEAGADAVAHLAAAMRAAHSLKGAARIVQFDAGVQLAHAMEDCLVGAQDGTVSLDAAGIDVLLACGDLLATLAGVDEAGLPVWLATNSATTDRFLEQLAAVKAGTLVAPAPARTTPVFEPPGEASAPAALPAEPVQDPVVTASAPERSHTAASQTDPRERTLKVGAHTLNRLMGLAGETLVQSRWFDGFSHELALLKRCHADSEALLEQLQSLLTGAPPAVQELLDQVRARTSDGRQRLTMRQADLDAFALRTSGLSDRLYREVVATRMRPFGDGVESFPRVVRDLARQLGKQAQLEIAGRNTDVDREILDRLEAPLNHMLRNSLDHGLETAEERTAAGKPPSGTIRLEARHRAGLFVLTVSDDGRGVDLERLRVRIVNKELATADMAARFSEAELLEFLFLPGFSTAAAVSDMSGRGVGLDAVQEMARSVGGLVRMTSRPGRGASIQLELPLTLSVVRTFVAEVSGQPLAFPLTRIARVVMPETSALRIVEGQQYFDLDDERVGIVPAWEVLGMARPAGWTGAVPVVLLGDRASRFGLAVDRFIGEFDMVVRPLDPRLGKVQHVSATALMEDGSAVLIVDVEDLTRSVEMALEGGGLRGIGPAVRERNRRRRILVVDDSITVRELERALLVNAGYDVDVAVDGVDGWNALRAGDYDLTVSDVDMPRMTGIELVARIKADPDLRSMPVIIVSYKDREEDRLKGLEVGADRYMTKSSFHDQSLLSAVGELIGPAA